MDDNEIISRYPLLMSNYACRDADSERLYREELISIRKLLPEDHPLRIKAEFCFARTKSFVEWHGFIERYRRCGAPTYFGIDG